MSILIEHHPARKATFLAPAAAIEGPETAVVWRSPTRGSIVALDAADAFAALLHHRIMVEAARIERAVRGSVD